MSTDMIHSAAVLFGPGPDCAMESLGLAASGCSESSTLQPPEVVLPERFGVAGLGASTVLSCVPQTPSVFLSASCRSEDFTDMSETPISWAET